MCEMINIPVSWIQAAHAGLTEYDDTGGMTDFTYTSDKIKVRDALLRGDIGNTYDRLWFIAGSGHISYMWHENTVPGVEYTISC